MTKEIKVRKEQETSVDTFITQAIQNGLPVETMEKLFSLREKVKAEAAKEAYVRALARFQADCPTIVKTKKVLNKDGRTVRYVYAPIDSIVEQIKKPLSDNGLSYSWEVRTDDRYITSIAKITHELGHSETSEFKVPIDTEGYMTAPQKFASAQTFAKRYSLCNALGISTADEDTDANDVGPEKSAKSDKSKIMFLLKELGKETDTKESIQKNVKLLTKLDLVERNYPVIVERLEILVNESNEDREIQ